jgi:virginiamycin B lyase
MTSIVRHIALRHRRFGVLLGALAVFVACLVPATASAQRCTVGVDISSAQDRYPSACARFELPPGLRALGPAASGPGNGVTIFASGAGGPVAVRFASDGRASTLALPSAVSAVHGATRGPDGAQWFTTGNFVGRLDDAGTVTMFPAPATGQITPGPDGALWFVAGATVGTITTSGNVTLLGLPAGLHAGDGIAAGPDRAVWFGAGDAIGRIDSGGAISSFRLPAGTHADGRMSSAGDGAMWFTDRRDQRIGRIDAHGAVRSFRTVGTPTGLARGADGATVWYATSTFAGGFINRLVIRDLPSGRARGVHCDASHRPACGRFDAVPSGNTVLLNAFGATGEVTRSDDGHIWFPQTRYVGRVLPFRGALLCGGKLRASLHSLHAAADCTQQAVPRYEVTHSGVGYVRLTCPRLTLRYCAGTIDLRGDASSRGGAGVVGHAGFAILAFDNPTVAVPLSPRAARAVRRGALRLRATIRAHDGGGLTRVTTAWLSLSGVR